VSDRRYPRTARVNEVVHEVLADELARMSDPRLELVTITGVEVSADLKHARVFYSSLASEVDETEVTSVAPVRGGRQETSTDVANALESARRPLQSALGRQVRLKYVPKLVFEEDRSMRTGQRIEEIIRDLHPDGEGQ